MHMGATFTIAPLWGEARCDAMGATFTIVVPSP